MHTLHKAAQIFHKNQHLTEIQHGRVQMKARGGRNPRSAILRLLGALGHIFTGDPALTFIFPIPSLSLYFHYFI